MSGLKFDSVRKVYDGEIVAIEEFSLDVEDDEFLTIVGPSGSGKSTLMRMVAGLEDITSGEISIDGRVVNDIPPQNRNVAMVFQNYALYPHMTVRKNMSYGLKMGTDLSNDEIDRRVEEAAEMLDISELLEKKPGNLSGGQQQRVATGRAIVREPAVFLMDEPLSNLDAKLRTTMRTELQRIHDQIDVTTIYVTHDQEEAMTMSDRIVILAEGICQQVGTPEDVYERPANLFVADFIGSPSMNFFDVTLEDTRLVSDAFEYELPAEMAGQFREAGSSDRFTMGVRPESIELADSAPSGQTFTATIDVREPIGSDNYLYLRLGDTGTECTMRVPGKVKPSEGSTIDITIDPEDVHVFDAETEENLAAEDTPTVSSPEAESSMSEAD